MQISENTAERIYAPPPPDPPPPFEPLPTMAQLCTDNYPHEGTTLNYDIRVSPTNVAFDSGLPRFAIGQILNTLEENGIQVNLISFRSRFDWIDPNSINVVGCFSPGFIYTAWGEGIGISVNPQGPPVTETFPPALFEMLDFYRDAYPENNAY